MELTLIQILAAEITWALIHGLMRTMKVEIDNMFQGYWQSTTWS